MAIQDIEKVPPLSTPTLGMSRVRASFNPSSNYEVDHIKAQTAGLIDWLETRRPQGYGTSGEINRLISLAQTAYEEAAMWAVKAVTG